MRFVRLVCLAVLFAPVMPLTSCQSAKGLSQAAVTTVRRAPSSISATANRTMQTLSRTVRGY